MAKMRVPAGTTDEQVDFILGRGRAKKTKLLFTTNPRSISLTVVMSENEDECNMRIAFTHAEILQLAQMARAMLDAPKAEIHDIDPGITRNVDDEIKPVQTLGDNPKYADLFRDLDNLVKGD